MEKEIKNKEIEKIKELELLAPAKDFKSGKAAILAGADALYIGGPQFSARSAAGNSWEDIKSLIDFAHQYYVKVYLALNTIFFDDEIEKIKEMINKAYEIGMDAVIIQDMGIMEMDLPPIPVFASTQANNYEAEQVKFLEDAGFSRVILARECGLEKIKEIKTETKIDLEAFVHGSLCVSFSGRCYLSRFLSKRSANRGNCIQACRLPFSLVDARGKIIIKDRFLLSLKDLNLSGRLQDLIDAGVTSFKIEGRLKNEAYAANVTAKYRQEIDKIISEKKGQYKKSSSGYVKLDFEPDLEKTFNRGYTDYFLSGRKKEIISHESQKSLGKFMGKVAGEGKDYFVLDCANDLKNGDGLCWFNDKGDLEGANVNFVEDFSGKEKRIYLNKRFFFRKGADIYRNMDIAFEKKVLSGAKRKIAADFIFEETEKGFKISAEDEDKNKVEKEFIFERKQAEKKDLQKENWKMQFSKLGNSIFNARNFYFNFACPYFVPASVLNIWRRDLIEDLFKERMKNYLRVSVKHKKTYNACPRKELDYSFNVSNGLAIKFYQKRGAKVLEPSFEQQKNLKGKKLMETKHCLRHFLGACPKNLEKSRLEFKEPLFLFYNKQKFRLKFDCIKCVMEVWGE